uniref:Uncharacterized protein n=1 Tax=Ditylum brightwellii TaxID=49249 RepID=A0A7S4RYD4_9STRA
MEMVLMQAMHVYFHWNGNAWVGMEMPEHRWGGMTWMEKQQVMSLVGSVALSSDGKTFAVGAMMEMVLMQAMHVYSIGMEMPGRYWNGSAWAQRGDDLDGEAAGDDFGYSVALSSDGKTLAVGAKSNDGNGNNAGRARVFHWNGNAWAQRGCLGRQMT